jgi:hypothetical protein
MQDNVASVSLIDVCFIYMYCWYNIARAPYNVVWSISPCFIPSSQNWWSRRNCSFEMANSPTYRCPHWLHWLPMPGASHWEIKDNILERTISHSLILCSLKVKDDSHPLPTVILHSRRRHQYLREQWGQKVRVTHSKFSSLRYNQLSHPFSHSLMIYIYPSIIAGATTDPNWEISKGKRYGSTHIQNSGRGGE